MECVVSAASAADPVSAAAPPFATATSRLATTATTTVRTLSSALLARGSVMTPTSPLHGWVAQPGRRKSRGARPPTPGKRVRGSGRRAQDSPGSSRLRIECSRRGWFLEVRLRRTDVLVLGAGPTGLGAAGPLHADGGADWLLVEEAPGPGGAAASVTDPAGFTWDLGGHVMHSHFPLFDDVIARVVDDWSFPRRSG